MRVREDKRRPWVAILIQHVILEESDYEQFKTIDKEGEFWMKQTWERVIKIMGRNEGPEPSNSG
jgi:hypothetical protein